jgi:alpha-beta hydrolase superfamily lysophospholipase
VVTPSGAGGPFPVVLWAHGTTGIARACAPSALAQPFESGALFVLQRIVDQGWAVVAPDYPGLGAPGRHPYLVGIPAARSALDAVRAARAVDGVELSDDTVAWGHSQGGGAALWVGEEARGYAPDVPIAGVAALAPASDILSLARGLQRSPVGMLFATFVVQGYSNAYPDVAVDAYVRPSAQAVVRRVVGRCLSERTTLASLPAVLTGQSLFSRDLTTGPLGERARENIPDAPTGIPTLLAQGLSDALVLPDVQRAFAERLCAAGQPLDVRTYPGRVHVGLVADDSPLIPELLRWTQDRLAGVPARGNC